MKPAPTGNDASMTVRLRQLLDQVRHRLLFLPVLFVIAGIALSQSMLRIDRSWGDDDVPDLLKTTVDSARSILTAISGGLITSITLLLSMMLVAVQLRELPVLATNPAQLDRRPFAAGGHRVRTRHDGVLPADPACDPSVRGRRPAHAERVGVGGVGTGDRIAHRRRAIGRPVDEPPAHRVRRIGHSRRDGRHHRAR